MLIVVVDNTWKKMVGEKINSSTTTNFVWPLTIKDILLNSSLDGCEVI